MDALQEARETINRVDREMAALFEERMHAAEKVAAYKMEHGLPVKDEKREQELIARNTGLIGDPALKPYYARFLRETIDLSCEHQTKRMAEAKRDGTHLFVNVAHQPYEIVLENGVIGKAGALLDLNRKVLVVTDSGVPMTYAETVAAQCREAVTVVIPQGEKSKNPEQLMKLLNTMLAHDFTRRDCVVAVGGGVVGDLAGFTASCYMRGVDFYNIPTTLLSQVDSSVGGKTAVDFESVKNAVGAFWQPKKVLIDPELLKTLDKRQVAAGMAEIIKMAATNDQDLFEAIEACEDREKALPEFIAGALAIKIAVVEEDPQERGLRRVLNFGHTVGHAIESTENGKLLHGECVALGMLPMASASARERIKNVLKKYGLPTAYAAHADVLAPSLKHDKKKIDAKICVVKVETIGSFLLTEMTPEDILLQAEAIL